MDDDRTKWGRPLKDVAHRAPRVNNFPTEKTINIPTEKTIIPPATHIQSLTIATSTPEQWKDVHDSFADMIRIVGKDFPSVSMHSHTLDNDPGVEADTEYYDQYTIVRVQRALERVGIDTLRATMAITEMTAAGILFRERTP